MLTEGLAAGHSHRWPLLERETELQELALLLAEAQEGHARLMLIEGEPGIGKTRLLQEVGRQGGSSGFTVLTARGGELERDLGYGIVRQLLESTLAQGEPASRERLLTGAARLAEPVFASDLREVPDGRPTHAALHGLYWVVANLSERSPLLLCIDDVHWGDAPSLRFLLHLARRLDGLPVAVALASRRGEEGPHPQLWRALALEVRPPILCPRPLSEVVVRGVVTAVLGADVSARLGRACHQATGGNPFLLSELLDELQRAGRPVAEINPGFVQGLAPERVRASLLLRIGGSDPIGLALARAVAVLGAQATSARVASLVGLDAAAVRLAAETLAQVGVLDRAEPLRFRHPILRSAIYEDMTVQARDALHAGAARLLAAEGASPETVAGHLLATPPRSEHRLAALLRAAAANALARGSPETAVRYLRRALDEPPEQGERARVLLDLGTAEALVFEPSAVAHLRRATTELDSHEERARASVRLAGVLAMTPEGAVEAVEALERAIADVSNTDAALASRLTAHAINLSRMHPRARERTQPMSARLAELVDAGTDEPSILAAVAADMTMAGDPAEPTAELAERALLAMGPVRFTRSDWSAQVAVRALVFAERFAAARRTLAAELFDARTRGDVLAVATLSQHMGELLWQLGELSDAEEEANLGHAICVEQGWIVGLAGLVATLVDLRLERADVDGAAALVDGPLAAPANVLQGTYTFILLLAARGRLRLAQARPDDALVDLLEAGRRLTELGEVSPALVTWRRSAVLACLSLGDVKTARRLADEELQRAREHGGQRALGVSLRVAGLAAGDDAGTQLLAEAVRHLERSEARLEHARTLVDLGAAIRRAGRTSQARETLTEGMGMAHRCGATAVVQRAHHELTVAGARPRRTAITGLDALTPSERRVARMAAEGMANKEIAQALFVTLRTIEMHLSSAYRKLGITSRWDLHAALGDG